MQRLIVLAVLAAALIVPSPATASTGLHVQPTEAADTAGCHGLDVMNGDQIVRTLAPRDGTNPDGTKCAYNTWSAVLPNGLLIFDWNLWERVGRYQPHNAHVWSSDGTLDGTQSIFVFDTTPGMPGWGPICANIHRGPIVGQTAYLRTACSYPKGGYNDVHIEATDGLTADTFTLPGGINGHVVGVNKLVVYPAYDVHGGSELYVSDGTPEGSHLLKDIWSGPRSSLIKNLVSHGSYATFTANDGNGRAHWITDGMVKGTHKVAS